MTEDANESVRRRLKRFIGFEALVGFKKSPVTSGVRVTDSLGKTMTFLHGAGMHVAAPAHYTNEDYKRKI